MISGYVRFYQCDGLHKHKDWEFANAYMLRFHESFNYKDNKPMTCNIIISPGILRVNGFIYENEWNPSNPFEKKLLQPALSVIDEEESEKEEEKEPEKDNIIHIYHTGHISKVDFENHKTVTYIYHDKNDCEHHLGEYNIRWVDKLGLGKTLKTISESYTSKKIIANGREKYTYPNKTESILCKPK